MIAVVTSTIKPLVENNKQRSFYTFEQRLQQTKNTLNQLAACAFKTIYLIDNSPTLNHNDLRQLLSNYPDVHIYHIQEYQFENKGINELLMLLYISKHLPEDQIIFKISGRYHPIATFKKPDLEDFAAKGYNYHNRNGTISTRAYWVKDSKVLHRFLLSCLDEVFTYPKRVTGIRSLYNKFGQIFLNKAVNPLNISIEFAAANVLKKGNYNLKLLNEIGIEGLIAGADDVEKITE